MKKRILPAFFLAMLSMVWAGQARATDGRAQLKKAVGEARITLAQAIEAAQKEIAGGKVVEAGLEWIKTPAYYEVDMLVDGKMKDVKVDARTGKVIGVEAEEADGEGDQGGSPNDAKETAEKTQALGAAKMTLAAAIEAGQKEAKGGNPIGVEMGMDDGQARIEVGYLVGDKIVKTEMDAVTGKIVEVEDEPVPLVYWLFDEESPGQIPTGLLARETHPGKKMGSWKIAADPGAPTKPNVLTLQTDESGGTFNLAIMDKTSYKDLDLRVRLRSNTGKEDQGGGLIWRCKDENNYYICRMNPLESNFRVYKVVNGKREQLKSAKVQTKTGKWCKLRIEMIGDNIACYLDGKKYLEAKDDTFKDAGMVGLWTKADASSSFDNLVVYPPPAKTHEAKEEHEAKGKAKGEGEHEDKDDDDDDDD